MSPIEICVRDFFNQSPQQNIMLAYSGGVDSQVLLHVLARLQQQGELDNALFACHVNHGLSENALLWQQSAEQTCLALGIALTICQVKVQARPQQSLEALARDARYQALEQSAPENALIVTGHHSDDQSETFLLALKRGAGLKGLSAMAKTRRLGQHLLVRPLLAISREQIKDYARQHQLSWLEDESNQDLAFDRNFIRHQIMPVLNQRWPSITSTIKRSSEHCREAQTLLNELAQDDLTRARLDLADKTPCLSVPVLSQLSQARFSNLLRYFLAQANALMPSTMQLAQVHQQVFAAADKCPAIKIGEHWLRRFKGGLHLTADFRDITAWQQQVDLTQAGLEGVVDQQQITQLLLPDDLGLLQFELTDTDALNMIAAEPQAEQIKQSLEFCLSSPLPGQKVSVKFAHHNPHCLPDFRHQARPVKKVLQELGIAPWARKRIPFIYYDDILVAALGHFICKAFVTSPSKPHLAIRWLVRVNSG